MRTTSSTVWHFWDIVVDRVIQDVQNPINYSFILDNTEWWNSFPSVFVMWSIKSHQNILWWKPKLSACARLCHSSACFFIPALFQSPLTWQKLHRRGLSLAPTERRLQKVNYFPLSLTSSIEVSVNLWVGEKVPSCIHVYEFLRTNRCCEWQLVLLFGVLRCKS